MTVECNIAICINEGRVLFDIGRPTFPSNYFISVEQAKKVQVELFYETLCPNVKNFIQGQLVPVWEDLSDIMEIHWKPYGFAKVYIYLPTNFLYLIF